MRSQTNGFTIVFCLLLFACSSDKQQQSRLDFKSPNIIEAKAYKVPLEKMTPPKVIPVSGVKKTVAGKPEIVQLKSNVFSAQPVSVIEVTSPLPTAHGKGYQLPLTTRVIDSPFLAGVPEIIAVNKDFYNKDENAESFSSISVAHGLKYAEVNALLNDRAGNIWIATWDGGGLSKYDGRTLTNYSVAQGLSSEHVFSLLEDRNGNIWIGTDHNSVNKFDGKFITQYKIGNGLANNFVLSIRQDKKGDIWFATKNGLVRYDGRSFTDYTTAQGLAANYIVCIFEDSKGNLWVGTRGGICRFDGHLFQDFTSAFGLSQNVQTSGEVNSIAEDKNGNLWIATNNDGLYRYDGKSISHFTTQGGLSSNKLSQLVEDKKGDIWIGTLDSGLNKFDGRSFTHYRTEQGLNSERIFSMVVDKRGTLWLGTGGGVNRHDGRLFTHIQEALESNNEVIACTNTDKNQNIWIGTARGSLIKYDGESITRFTSRQGLPSRAITDILEDKSGNIWMATWQGGVIKYDGRSFTQYSTGNGLIDNEVIDLLEDKKGNIWIGTDGGISKFDEKYFTNYSTANGLSSDDINSLFEDHQGNLWVGTRDNGLSEFDRTSFKNYNITNGLGNAAVTCIAEDKNNNLWLGTNAGLIKFDRKHFTHYTTEQGLNGNIVTNVLELNSGDIWVGTNNGLNRFSAHAAGASGIDRIYSLFKKYTSSEGFLGVWGYYKTMIEDKNGDMWIGAWDRLTRYHPEGDIPDTIPPTIQLTGVALFDENINWLEMEKKKDSTFILNNGTRLKNFNFSGLTPWYNQPENLQLSHNNDHITFKFIGITTNRPKEVRYQYILEGLDENWSSATIQPTATYNNLPHGKFTFRIKAANSEGYWSTELRYSFIILAPWWKTWWAYLLYGIGFVFAMWTLIWYRSRRLKSENILLEEKVINRTHELEQSLEQRYELSKKIESQQALMNERLRISRELHDDIGSTLGSISIYSEVAKNRTAKNESTVEVLAKIGTASRELIEKMSDIVWSLNPNNENFEELQNRMHAFANMILIPRNIQYDFVVDKDLNLLRLTSAQSKNIFLIYKEALYNTTKYAECEKVTISLRRRNDDLIMTIQDNGKGFDVINGTSSEGNGHIGEYVGGNGVKNMHARAGDMKAKLLISSKKNEGTTLELTLGLSQE